MSRALLLLIVCVLALGACTQKMICPAYQSAFIHDQHAQYRQFSYFNEDSTPKILTVSKDRYLIIPEQSYRKKIRSMQTIEMKPIYPALPDSLKPDKPEDEFAGAERESVPDSVKTKKAEPVDSAYAITKDREVRILRFDPDSVKYHVENVMFTADQDNYMWYFRDVLVLPDVRAALDAEKNAKEGKAAGGKSPKKEKKGFFASIKDLFKKKPKTDSAAAFNGPKANDSTTVERPKEKRGLFNRKKKEEPPPEEKPVVPAKKEEDGF